MLETNYLRCIFLFLACTLLPQRLQLLKTFFGAFVLQVFIAALGTSSIFDSLFKRYLVFQNTFTIHNTILPYQWRNMWIFSANIFCKTLTKFHNRMWFLNCHYYFLRTRISAFCWKSLQYGRSPSSLYLKSHVSLRYGKIILLSSNFSLRSQQNLQTFLSY